MYSWPLSTLGTVEKSCPRSMKTRWPTATAPNSYTFPLLAATLVIKVLLNTPMETIAAELVAEKLPRAASASSACWTPGIVHYVLRFEPHTQPSA